MDRDKTYHQPALEQQSPKVEPLQVKPAVPPQVPSVETLRLAPDVGDEALPDVEEEETEDETVVETVEIELT